MLPLDERLLTFSLGKYKEVFRLLGKSEGKAGSVMEKPGAGSHR